MAFDPLTAGLELGKSIFGIISKVVPDAEKAQQITQEINQQVNQQVLGQIEMNKAEAASPSLFVAGWRPATGWTCVGGLVYQVILRPVIQSIIILWYPNYAMVSLEIETLMTLLFGMLGLGAYRTYEKVSGKA